METPQTHCYAAGTVTLPWKCNKLTTTQQELLRYHGNAIWCIDHVTKENLICHNIVLNTYSNILIPFNFPVTFI
jgi:hypothetical protein